MRLTEVSRPKLHKSPRVCIPPRGPRRELSHIFSAGALRHDAEASRRGNCTPVQGWRCQGQESGPPRSSPRACAMLTRGARCRGRKSKQPQHLRACTMLARDAEAGNPSYLNTCAPAQCWRAARCRGRESKQPQHLCASARLARGMMPRPRVRTALDNGMPPQGDARDAEAWNPSRARLARGARPGIAA